MKTVLKTDVIFEKSMVENGGVCDARPRAKIFFRNRSYISSLKIAIFADFLKKSAQKNAKNSSFLKKP